MQKWPTEMRERARALHRDASFQNPITKKVRSALGPKGIHAILIEEFAMPVPYSTVHEWIYRT